MAWFNRFLLADGSGSSLYSRSTAVARVRNRWPPRATAALDAFLNLSNKGSAMGYDMQVCVKVCEPLLFDLSGESSSCQENRKNPNQLAGGCGQAAAACKKLEGAAASQSLLPGVERNLQLLQMHMDWYV